MNNDVRADVRSRLRIIASSIAPRARARLTICAISVLLLPLVLAGTARGQGSPDIVWQGAHTNYLRYTVFSPDGQLLISGGDDRTNKVWQAADGTLVRTIVQCSGVRCAGSTFGLITPDSQTLLTSGLKFWRIADGTLQRTLGIGGNIAVSPDWQYIASSSSSSNYPGNETRNTALFRLSDGSQVWTKADGGGQVAFSPDGKTVAAVGFQGIDIWRVSDGAFVGLIPGPRKFFGFSPDGQFAITAEGGGGAFRYDDTIKVYRVSDGALVRMMSGVGVVNSAVFTPDGQTLITGSWETNQDPVNGYASQTGSIRFWRFSDGALLKTYDQTTGTSVNGLAVSPDGKFFSYTYDSTVIVARMPSFPCVFQISPARADLPASGGGGSVTVNAPDGCSWRAVSRVNWINITSGGAGTGNGTVTFQTNKSGNDITGLLIIAEQTFTVHLGDPSCTYTVNSDGTTFSPPGGTGQLGVSRPTGCGWDAKSNTDWITITKFSRTGGGITYSVAPNDGPPRSGTITIAGQTVTINQGTDPCSYSVHSNNSTTYDSNGGNGSASVGATNHCPWTASTDADWITLQTTSGSGNATVSYFVNAKTTIGSRTGHITIAGQTFTIFQTGISCDYAISPTHRSFAADGGSAYISVTSQSACGLTARSNADWITITSVTSNSGYGTVYYTVAPYSGIAPRTGTITLAGGLTFTVYQGNEPIQGPPTIVWTGTGHTSSANAVAFSPDGQLLASGSNDRTVKVWRVFDGALLMTLTGFNDSVTSVAFSRNGRTLAAGGKDNTVRIWNVSDWSPVRTLTSTDFVFGVAFSSDDSLLAQAGGYTGDWIRIWRTSDWQQVATIGYGPMQNSSVAYSSDGQFIASGQFNNEARLQNLSSGLVRTLGHQGVVNSIAFSPDSKTLATGSNDQSVGLWEVAFGTQLFSLNGPSGFAKGVAFSPDGKILLAGGQDSGANRGTILFWRVSDGALMRTYVGQTSTAVLSVQYSPNGSFYAYARADGAVILALNPFLSSRPLPPPPAPPSPVSRADDSPPPAGDGTIGPEEESNDLASDSSTSSKATSPQTAAAQNQNVVWQSAGSGSAVTFSPDGQMLLEGNRLRRASDGQLIRTFSIRTSGGQIDAVAFSPDSQYVAMGVQSFNLNLSLFRVSDGVRLAELTGSGNGTTTVKFSPDGQFLACGGRGGTVKLLHVPDMTLVKTFLGGSGYSARISALLFSPDGQFLAVGGQGGAQIIRVSDGVVMQTLVNGSRTISSLALSPDGQTLATGFFTADPNNLYPVKFWRFSDGALLNTIEASDQGILALAFQPDGRVIATGGGDDTYAGVVRFFRLSDSTQLGFFPQDPNNLYTYVTSIAYSPDGQLVAYARHDNFIVVARNPFASSRPPPPPPAPPSPVSRADDSPPPAGDGTIGPEEPPPDIR